MKKEDDICFPGRDTRPSHPAREQTTTATTEGWRDQPRLRTRNVIDSNESLQVSAPDTRALAMSVKTNRAALLLYSEQKPPPSHDTSCKDFLGDH
ncbi:hypothetical protein RRG08_035903 [Elysia crispata]|uniref:Uncharacterized protein n=1 Tax=Elysia crispata TaxID=231223 RepID=A0AAE1A245_9GAST|nr:hypothetical protein RRG08_035903 [Elysia crispata]